MKRQSAWAISAAVMSVTLGVSLGGCGDPSAPNRRGLERPPLVGNGGLENADKRELEAPKRDLPTGGGKEFPGQGAAPSYQEPGRAPILYLDDVATTTAAALVTDPVTGAVIPTTVPATQPAPAFVAAIPPIYEPAPKTVQAKQYCNDVKPYALNGKPMPVAGTGLWIPPEWGQPTVLQSYPHRPWANTSVNYTVGTTWHNPIYFRPLFDRVDGLDANSPDRGVLPGSPDTRSQNMDLGMGGVASGNLVGVADDLLETPWFLGQTLALPVLMILDRPWDQRTTRNVGGAPLYLGKLPPTGPAVPAALPGEIRYVYPFSTPESETPATTNP